MTSESENGHETDAGGALISSISVEGLIAARDLALRTLADCHAAYQRACGAMAAFQIELPKLSIYINSHDVIRLDEETREEVQYEIDRVAWIRLWGATNVDTLMDADTRSKLHESLHRSKWQRKESFRYRAQGDYELLPPLTVENIRSTFARVHESRADYFGAAVEAVFRKISWDYKTNQPCKFSEKMIIGNGFDYSHYGNGVNLRQVNSLVDLERVLAILDGQPPPTHDTGLSAMPNAPYGKWVQVRGALRDLFKVKCFKKGTKHVVINSPGLIDGMNSIIAKRFPGVLSPKRGE